MRISKLALVAALGLTAAAYPTGQPDDTGYDASMPLRPGGINSQGPREYNPVQSGSQRGQRGPKIHPSERDGPHPPQVNPSNGPGPHRVSISGSGGPSTTGGPTRLPPGAVPNQDSTPSVMRGMMRSNLKVLPLGLLLALHRSQVVRDLRTVTIQACQRDLIVTGPDTLRATTMSMITFMITTSLAGMAKTRMTRIKTGETVMARMTTRERMARDMETSLTEHRLQASFCTLGHLH
jgi:hypothetical protein